MVARGYQETGNRVKNDREEILRGRHHEKKRTFSLFQIALQKDDGLMSSKYELKREYQ